MQIMEIAVFLGKEEYASTPDFTELSQGLRQAGCNLQLISGDDALPSACDLVLSVGGDGTYLRAARLCSRNGLPLMGVNFGRLGFLSEFSVEAAVSAIKTGSFRQKETPLLQAFTGDKTLLAMNEVVVHRAGPAMLGVRVEVDGKLLPTYWGDGLVIASAAGSTAYNMSVGGPIVLPSSKVFVIAPVAPHNLNVRPLVVPSDCRICMSFDSREDVVGLSADNQQLSVSADRKIEVSMAQFSLKRLCPVESSFIQALKDKLFWGEDKRNER